MSKEINSEDMDWDNAMIIKYADDSEKNVAEGNSRACSSYSNGMCSDEPGKYCDACYSQYNPY